MAELVLSPLLQVVFEKLVSPVLDGLQSLGFIGDLKNEIEKLRNAVLMIQAVLEDAEEQQINDKAVRIWLTKLQDVVYDADDLLDEFLALSLSLELQSKDKRYKEWFFFSITMPFRNYSTMERKLKQVREALDVIAAERSNFHLREGIVYRQAGRRQTGSFIIESDVYGREDDREKIAELLLADTNIRGDVSVIPIVGIGGLGKTTLAQLVYNDERVKTRFELRMWVCVTDDFNVRRLVKAIIESATKIICNSSEMDVLQSRLRESLSVKRYLLVLDDVWNDDQEEWDELKTLLRSGVGGSKIIVTTRSKKVASIMGTTSPHHLEGLSEDNCWALFKQRAFGQWEENDYPNLLAIGKQIVTKCGGVLLAAKTLGSLMRFKREEIEWVFVQESGLWELGEQEN